MSEGNKRAVVIVVETVRESVTKDAFSFAAVLGMVGIGWLIGSTALQWVGAGLFILGLASRASAGIHRVRSIQEARNLLDMIEGNT